MKSKNSKNSEIETIISSLERRRRLTTEHLKNNRDLWDQIPEHLRNKNPRQILHHLRINSFEIPRCVCGNSLSWHPDKRRYRSFCSRRCTAKNSVETIKKHNRNHLGVEWHTQTRDWREKVKSTSLEKYGVEHYSQTPQWSESVKNTNRHKYGRDHVMHVHIPESTLEILNQPERLKKILQENKTRRQSAIFLGIDQKTLQGYFDQHDIDYDPVCSYLETEMAELLTEFDVNFVRNTRNIVRPWELDFYLPDHNLAIEMNGSYHW